MHLPKYVYFFWPEKHFFWFGTPLGDVFGRLCDAVGWFLPWFWVHSSTTGRGNDFLKMSLAVCLLLFNPCGRSWLRKSNCSVFFAVPSRVTLLASSGVVWAASCGASGVVLGLRWGGGDGRIASFRLALSSRYFVDPPFFCLSPSSDNIS